MIQRGQPAKSGYTGIDQTVDASTYVRRLDQMRADSFWQVVKAQTFELLRLLPGDSVLDVGCGTGDDVLALANLVGPHGRAVGVDRSLTMINEAMTRARAASSTAEFSLGDARTLDFPDASFDGCRAERLLQHLDAPEQVVCELVRVARPGARIVLVEPDYGTLSVSGADDNITHRILQVRRNHFTSGKIGRELPRLCRQAGLAEVVVTLRTLTNSVFTLPSEKAVLDKYVAAATMAGVVSAAEAAQWLAELAAAGRCGRYRHTLTLFTVCACKARGSQLA